MTPFIRGLLAAAIITCPMLARAGHGGCRTNYCYTPVRYVTPVVAAPIVKSYPSTTYQVVNTFNYGQYPAQQGSSQFGLSAYNASYSQQDLAIPASFALAQRYSDNGATIAGYAYGAQQLAATNQAAALVNNAQALRIAETQTKAAAAERYLQSITPQQQQATVTVQQQGYSQQGGYVQQPQGNGYAQQPQGQWNQNGQQPPPPAPQPAPQPDLQPPAPPEPEPEPQQGNLTLGGVYQTYCNECHGKDNYKTKGVNAFGKETSVFGLSNLDGNQKKVIRGRITTHNLEKRMPAKKTLPDDVMAFLLDSL